MIEKVILVDQSDNPLGEMEKLEAHKEGKLHRAVSVFIYNSQGKMLLQKRAECKYHSPGLWTNTACTHPRKNESNEAAATRRLAEEMGMKNIKLVKLFDFTYKEAFGNGLTEYEYDHVFIGVSDAEPTPEPSEVGDFEYVDTDTLLDRIKIEPDNYTVWFKKIINRVLHEAPVAISN